MNNSWYSLDISLQWVLLSFIVALALSFLLYSRKDVPWGKNINIFLGFLRLSAVSLLVILLFDPLLNLSLNKTEKPIVAVAIDDSESIALRTDSTYLKNFDQQVKNSVGKLEYDIETYYLSGRDQFSGFNEPKTDLGELVTKIGMIHEFDNLAGVVLISDGIHNSGASPKYKNFPFQIYSIGMGDTIPPRDLSITKVVNNKVAFKGNQFPIRVELSQNGFNGEQANIDILRNGKRVISKQVSLNQPLETFDFIIDADILGLNRYQIRVSELEGESSFENNKQDVVVDIIESTVKVLIVAAAPHPDISAIRQVLSVSKNYEVELFIQGLSKPPKSTEYSAIIYHNTLGGNSNFNSKGQWLILGSKTPIRNVNTKLSFLNINVKSKNDDKVRPALNNSFPLFNIEAEVERISDYPPLNVPFANYLSSGPSNILLYQKVGSVITDRPLMLFFDDGTEKTALTMSSGIWRWKLQEAGSFETSDFFNEMVLKTIQYISLNENKKRFIASARNKTFDAGEAVLIDTEVYNQIFERAYNEVIDITITDESGTERKQQIINAPNNNTFRIGGLAAGIYTYRASVNIGGIEEFQESGQFLIEESKLESILLTADHSLLKNLSKNSGGEYYHISQLESLIDSLEQANFKSLIRTEKSLFPLINTLWYILLIMLLLTSEWVIRKYSGAV